MSFWITEEKVRQPNPPKNCLHLSCRLPVYFWQQHMWQSFMMRTIIVDMRWEARTYASTKADRQRCLGSHTVVSGIIEPYNGSSTSCVYITLNAESRCWPVELRAELLDCLPDCRQSEWAALTGMCIMLRWLAVEALLDTCTCEASAAEEPNLILTQASRCRRCR